MNIQDKLTLCQNPNCVIKCHGLDVEGGEDGLFVCQGGVIIGGDLETQNDIIISSLCHNHLSREDDAHVTQVHIHGPQVCAAQGRTLKNKIFNQNCFFLYKCRYVSSAIKWVITYIKNGYFGQILQSLPLTSEVLHTAHNDHVFELMIMEVGGSERHHQVPQTNQRGVRVSKEADNNMTIEDSHGGLVTVLRSKCHHYHHVSESCHTDQDAVLNGPSWDPVEHPRAVILHLRLDEVKVPSLKRIWIIIINYIMKNMSACSSAMPTSILPKPV